MLIVVLLIAAVVFLAWRLYASQRRITGLRFQLLAALPYIRSRGEPAALLDQFFNADDWEFVESAGDNRGGNFGGIGLCPCQKSYTANTRQNFFAQKPNAQQLQNCLNNPPPPAANDLPCPDDCVPVMTHIWTGVSVHKNRKTGQFLLNCTRYAQYHCKKPDDPARDAPPIEEPPPPDVEA